MTTISSSKNKQRRKFDACIATLTDYESHRVWSLIVTFFGDLAQEEGDRVSGAVLTQVGILAGVKREAMRVAIHRLRRDGWISSERAGRASFYSLTEHGRSESAGASPRIYSTSEPIIESWTLALAASNRKLEHLLQDSVIQKEDRILIDDRLALLKNPIADPVDGIWTLTENGASVPDWVKGSLISDNLLQSCQRLNDVLSSLDKHCPSSLELTGLQSATLRTLIVHSWRRVVLRQPDVPHRFLPDDWKARDCRVLVAGLLGRLPRPVLADLESEVTRLQQTAA